MLTVGLSLVRVQSLAGKQWTEFMWDSEAHRRMSMIIMLYHGCQPR